jgi:hypothetical protein
MEVMGNGSGGGRRVQPEDKRVEALGPAALPGPRWGCDVEYAGSLLLVQVVSADRERGWDNRVPETDGAAKNGKGPACIRTCHGGGEQCRGALDLRD